MTGACKMELDKSHLAVPNFFFPLVDFLLVFAKHMGWSSRVGTNVFQSMYLEGGSTSTFISLSYFYFTGVSLAQSKFNWLDRIRLVSHSAQWTSLGCDNPFPWHTRESREKLEKRWVKRLHVPLGDQITIYWTWYFTEFPWGSLFPLDPQILRIYLQRPRKMLYHHKGEILLVLCKGTRRRNNFLLRSHYCFKEGIDYTGCNPNGDVDYFEIFQPPWLFQLIRK